MSWRDISAECKYKRRKKTNGLGNGSENIAVGIMTDGGQIGMVAVVLSIAVCWFIRDCLQVEGLRGKYIFITGCDSGFGQALAKYLDQKGFCIIATCLSKEGSQELLASTSLSLQTMELDLTNPGSIDKAVEFVQSETEGVDLRLFMRRLCNSDVSKVTKCMEHALTAKYPMTRYGVGLDAKFLWLPLSYAPTFLSDAMLRMLFPLPSGSNPAISNRPLLLMPCCSATDLFAEKLPEYVFYLMNRIAVAIDVPVLGLRMCI